MATINIHSLKIPIEIFISSVIDPPLLGRKNKKTPPPPPKIPHQECNCIGVFLVEDNSATACHLLFYRQLEIGGKSTSEKDKWLEHVMSNTHAFLSLWY